MWKDKTVSVVLPTYNEVLSIREIVERFYHTDVVDEVLVINNNAQTGTSMEVAKTQAREIDEPRQGYGFACRRGLSEATGDLIILSEPDGSFEPKDIHRLLELSDRYGIVQGSRTHRAYIGNGANMGPFLRYGNWSVSKYMEFLYGAKGLSDVGCTMRLVTREVLSQIQPYFTVGREHFGVQMTLLCLQSGIPFIEIPVAYNKRVGKSSVTGSKAKTVALGLKMIALISHHRITTCYKKK